MIVIINILVLVVLYTGLNTLILEPNNDSATDLMPGSSLTASISPPESQVGGSRATKRHTLSTIESSVTRLLVSTKHLLESLTQWARQEADDKFVSDAYVKLGNDFRAATRAFSGAGVDISDIGDVPQALRIILEAALSESPSQNNLDKFLPNIRNIIVTLLQNLKAKQLKAKSIAQEKHHQRSLTAEIEQIPSTLNDNSKRNQTNISQKQFLAPIDPSKEESNDALSQLQKGSHIQRRASKRFSAYQYAKLTNPALPSSRILSSDLAKKFSQVPSQSTITPAVSGVEKNSDVVKPSGHGTNSIYLQIGNKTKKVSVKLPVTLASLRLLFVEKFAYSPGSTTFPDIYIQDPNNSVTYELEEHMLNDEITSGTLLCLHEPNLQENTLKELTLKVQSLSTSVENLGADMSTQIREVVTSIEPSQAKEVIPVDKIKLPDKPLDPQTLGELRSIIIDLKIFKKSNSQFKHTIKEHVDNINGILGLVKSHSLETPTSSNRAYMESSHLKLSEESDQLLTKVDDLQDIMEALRKDVVQRGVRVGEKQLKHTMKDISGAKSSLNQMLTYINKEKNTWKRIWEAELDKVCEEQQFFNLQDDLSQDLEEDIKKIEETFTLIEECSLEQTKHGRKNKFVPYLPLLEPGASLHNVKDAVLGEVAALIPNHESRLEAIERAERVRIREREMGRLNKFQEELGEFVDDKKFKSSGGFDKLEESRKLRDEENLKSSFGII